MAVATPLWAADPPPLPPLPVKVPLTTTAVPANVAYMSPSFSVVGQKLFQLSEGKPTGKFVLGGVECTVRAEEVAVPMRDGNFHRYYKLILKTPTQELVFDKPFRGSGGKSLELTLDDGRKYLLAGHTYYHFDPDTKKLSGTGCLFYSGGVQAGKIGSSPGTSIALFDSNFDGFYTSGDDGIVIGSMESADDGILYDGPANHQFAQPLSKYISVPPPSGGIFEVRNIARDGSELTVLPYVGATASIEVNAPKEYSGQVVLTSSDTGLNATVKVGEKVESVTVIPGSYTVMGAALESRRLVSGDERSGQVFQILRMFVSGEGMPPLKVEAGAKQVFALSGPKTLEFQAALVDGKVNIKPETVIMKGQAGETYIRAECDRQSPSEVHLNVDGKTTMLGKMEYG